MDIFTWFYVVKEGIHRIFFKLQERIISVIRFSINEDEQTIKIEFVEIDREFRNNTKLFNFMCDVFSTFYYENFNDYYFDYLYLDKRFKYLINRKVKSGKLPQKVIEIHPNDNEAEFKRMKDRLKVSILDLELELSNLKIRNVILDNPNWKGSNNLKHIISGKMKEVEDKLNDMKSYDDYDIWYLVRKNQDLKQATSKFKEIHN